MNVRLQPSSSWKRTWVLMSRGSCSLCIARHCLLLLWLTCIDLSSSFIKLSFFFDDFVGFFKIELIFFVMKCIWIWKRLVEPSLVNVLPSLFSRKRLLCSIEIWFQGMGTTHSCEILLPRLGNILIAFKWLLSTSYHWFNSSFKM